MTSPQSTYSRDETIAAVQSFYDFLVEFYLPPNAIKHPPPGGWPDIDHAFFRPPKSDEVVDLIKNLPFVDARESDDEPYQVYEKSKCVDYSAFEDPGPDDFHPFPLAETIEITESTIVLAAPTSHDGYWFILDVSTGMMTLAEFGDNEWEEYAVPDFYEVIKSKFRSLEVYPIDAEDLEMASRSSDTVNSRLKAIFVEHGWPSKEFRKKECMRKIKIEYNAMYGWPVPEEDEDEESDVQELTSGMDVVGM
ncbi:hypothetical protein BU16DRAFT_556687 [Lophium mytilinum]|uniref:Uncharacterized protein n=1 Tax=Lophium mytilinum TaxID=390894 RepID=A0A6A6R634_9PEZI|nr:hypothetical protein BU16DRAFT_556687 [Lophium mytilinum]